MFISKITICNLFAYYGEQSVEFERKEGKNLYCIYGDNGFGKTSFIRCAKLLFLGTGGVSENLPSVIGRFAPNEKNYKKFIKGNSTNWNGILNKNALNEGKREFFVRFNGEIDGNKFCIERFWENVQETQIKETLFLQIDGQTYENDEAQHRLNNILPENFVEFFFFDGEEIENISDNLRTKLREKIVEILQISPLEIIIKQTQRLKDELIANESKNQELKDSLDIRKKQQDAKETEIQAKSNAINNEQIQLQENAQKIKNLERKLEKIIADSSAELQELTTEKNQVDKDLFDIKQSLISSIKSVVFASNATLIKRLQEEIDSIESNANKSDIEALKRLTPSMQIIAEEKIQDFIQESDTQESNMILKFKDLFSDIMRQMPSNLESKIAKESSKIPLECIKTINENIIRTESSSVKQDIENIKKLKVRLNQIKAEIYELNTDERAKIKQDEINDEIAKCKEKEKELMPILEANKSELEQLKIERANLQKEINNLEQSINTERIEHKLHLLKVLCESMSIYKDKLIGRLRDELHDKILEKYKQIIPNDNIAELEISEEFEIVLKDKYGEPIIVESQSSGQKQILAISIFWALSELSNSKIPLIIDTPLSRIDEHNRARIIKHYYAKGTQVIILPHSGEMGVREYDYVIPNLAGLYKIHNDNDRSHAVIKLANKEDIIFT